MVIQKLWSMHIKMWPNCQHEISNIIVFRMLVMSNSLQFFPLSQELLLMKVLILESGFTTVCVRTSVAQHSSQHTYTYTNIQPTFIQCPDTFTNTHYWNFNEWLQDRVVSYTLNWNFNHPESHLHRANPLWHEAKGKAKISI